MQGLCWNVCVVIYYHINQLLLTANESCVISWYTMDYVLIIRYNSSNIFVGNNSD